MKTALMQLALKGMVPLASAAAGAFGLWLTTAYPHIWRAVCLSAN